MKYSDVHPANSLTRRKLKPGETYRFHECGLDHILLSDIEVEIDPDSGTLIPVISKIRELVQVIALDHLDESKAAYWNGKTFWVVRKSLKVAPSLLAERCQVNEAQIRAWEDTPGLLPAETGALLRAKLREIVQERGIDLDLSHRRTGWHFAGLVQEPCSPEEKTPSFREALLSYAAA
jgi:DNA-binding transcriptional regulator YiaG